MISCIYTFNYQDIPEIACIYAIKNKKTSKMYIGQSTNIQQRIKDHRSSLKNNCHHNSLLQLAFDNDGQDSFSIVILEKITGKLTKEDLTEKEDYWILKFKRECSVYNMVDNKIEKEPQNNAISLSMAAKKALFKAKKYGERYSETIMRLCNSPGTGES